MKIYFKTFRYKKSMSILGIASLFSLIFLLIVVSCNKNQKGSADKLKEQTTDATESINSDSINSVISEDELANIYKEYLYFDRNVFVLKLSGDEASKIGISSSKYKAIISRLKEMNSFLEKTLNELKDGETQILQIPKERILDTLNIDPRIRITD